MIRLTILGQPCSKANSRELATFNRFSPKKGEMVKMPGFRKSDDAIEYERSAILQIPHAAKQMLTGPVRVTLHLFYETERPDLDESIVLDVLQAKYEKAEKGKPRKLIRPGVYINDRQVREKHVYHGIDKANPRAEIEVEALQPQQVAMFHVEQKEVTTTRAKKRMTVAATPALAALKDGETPF